jgi:hypothetical protein
MPLLHWFCMVTLLVIAIGPNWHNLVAALGVYAYWVVAELRYESSKGRSE